MQWPRRKNSAYLGLEKTASMAEAQWMNGNGKKSSLKAGPGPYYLWSCKLEKRFLFYH